MRKLLSSAALAALIAMFATHSNAIADDGYKFVQLEQTRDFSRAGAEHLRDGRAMLLMFSGDHCRFCITVEEDFLKPMLRSGDYDEMISMHKVQLSARERVIDFNGRRTTGRALAERYGVFVMPTVVFVDGNGNEVAPKRVGLMTEAYYGGYLDESIRAAAKYVQQREQLSAAP